MYSSVLGSRELAETDMAARMADDTDRLRCQRSIPVLFDMQGTHDYAASWNGPEHALSPIDEVHASIAGDHIRRKKFELAVNMAQQISDSAHRAYVLKCISTAQQGARA
jgi:hypothetical protein